MLIRFLCLLCLVAPQPGCFGGNDAAQQSAQQMEARLEAAKAINLATKRDEMLGKVALDAAAAGHGDVTLQAVSAIALQTTHDEIAAQAARALAASRSWTAATQVAQTIILVTRRDAVLAELAEQR